MSELTNRQRRKGLDYASEVAEIAAKSPDTHTRRELYSVVKSIRHRYGYTRQQKKDVILRCIGLGASTIGDMVNETKFSRDDVHELTRELESEKQIVSYQLRATGNGRPSFMFTIAEEV
ncbi:MAG: hypothetical protein ABI539_01240 [Acidobacteriota bacterium]